MKNYSCYCVKEDKLISEDYFSCCNICYDGCKTIKLLGDEFDFHTSNSDYPMMKKFVRNHIRQEKLKRILK
jgi:hypothetical protein